MVSTNIHRSDATMKNACKIPRRRVTVSEPCPPPFPSCPMFRRRGSLPIPKKVQFSESPHVCSLDNRLSSSMQDWYTLQDHARFKAERIYDLISLKGVSKEDIGTTVSFCPVGLEQFLSKRSRKESQESRKLVINAVLNEQNRQRNLGIIDHELLACSALDHSSCEGSKAVKRGKFQELAQFMD